MLAERVDGGGEMLEVVDIPILRKTFTCMRQRSHALASRVNIYVRVCLDRRANDSVGRIVGSDAGRIHGAAFEACDNRCAAVQQGK